MNLSEQELDALVKMTKAWAENDALSPGARDVLARCHAAIDSLRAEVKRLTAVLAGNRALVSALHVLQDWPVPITEEDPDDPQTEYGQIKRYIRQILERHDEVE